MVRCNINQGKYCNEPFCHYVFHQQEVEKWFQLWKNKIDAEWVEHRKKEIIEKKLVKGGD